MIVRRLGAALLGLGLLAAATPAHAVDGLEWQWSDDTARTYHIQGQIRLSRLIFFNAFNNIDARIFEARLELVTTCRAEASLGKKGWELACTIDDISLQAVPLPADAGRIDAVATEWDERLTGSVIQVQLTADGRIRNVGLDSLTRRNRRDGLNIERVRQLMARMLSPIDLRLPKKGHDDEGAGWAQKDALLTGFPSSTGSVGALDLAHQVQGKKDDVVKIASVGKGTVGNQDSAQQIAGQEAIDFYAMEVFSEAKFDTGAGMLLDRQVVVTAKPTASSSMADGTEGLPYVQAYRVELIREGQPRPVLPDSKEIQQAFADPS